MAWSITVNYTYGKAMTNSLGNYALNVNGYQRRLPELLQQPRPTTARPATTSGTTSPLPVSTRLPFGRGKEYLLVGQPRIG